MIELIIFLGFNFLIIIFCKIKLKKPFYPLSKIGKPFKEYDVDGFLTHESYQSHIKHYMNGRVEVDLGALTKTRAWKENIQSFKKLRQHLK